ncbi:unnamed protein product [Pneumocystis jirovecii]|uniref:Importin N-terminal domain-containing protein n=2 Tax=Pneumocystis jirovecii TaxID=42068 RepID=L0PD24_PNEJI|nr:uncharacterized protein T551_02299 [Pneumocystis jirovecii RU7]KTW29025.1 hypothetical protein T551_02299 [Pneumocystis jirovecii RU7]CCJ30132.1 unnamed protein product [Pneumocystis jirovecii]
MNKEILQALYDSVSQDASLIKLSEEKLKSWETVPEFYLTLQDIFLNKEFPVNVRWISIIYFKNGIDKYWRKSAKNSISFEKKEKIRKRILQGSEDKNHLLAVQNSLVAARIARLDFPHDWPHLFQELFFIIKNSTSHASDSCMLLHRHLYTLYQIVKNLCASRLVKARRNFQQIAPELFEFIYGAFKNYTDQWIHMFQSNALETDIFAILQISHLCFKILRRLIIYGFEYPYKNENLRSFFQLSYMYLKLYFNLCEYVKGDMCTFLYSYIILFGKMFLEFSSTQLTSIFLMPNSSELIMVYLDIIEKNADIFNEQNTERTNFICKIVIQGLLLIKHGIKFLHNSDLLLEFKLENYRQEIEETYKILEKNIFNPEMLKKILEILITKYMVLRPNDLFTWEENPEQWFLSQEKQSWEYDLRPCAESLLADIFSIYSKILSSPFLSLFQTIATSFDESTFLLKEAVYNAFGIGINFFSDSVDFDSIFLNIFSKDIQIHNQRISKIIYRRILILISQCTSLESSKNIQTNIYVIFEKFLNAYEESNDLAIQLTAAVSLKQCVDEWSFEEEQLLPYLKSIFKSLLHLINQCEFSDSKLKVLQVINVIIERIKQQILPYAQNIIDTLPLLWEQSEEGHLLKVIIIITLTKLVKSLKKESEKYHPLIIQLIQYSISSSLNTNIYLIEDTLELWHSLLQETQNSSFQILSLIPLAINFLDYGNDVLKKILCIFESYILLSGDEFMKHYSLPFLSKFSNLLGNLHPDTSHVIIRVLDFALQTTSIHLYANTLVSSGCIFKILESIMINKELKPIVIQYFSLISRISLQNPHIILDFLGEFSFKIEQNSPNNQEIISNFLNIWISIFDNIGNPKYRKLNVMGITALLITNNPYVLININHLINIWSETLSEIKENKEGDALIYWNKHDDENYLSVTNSSETIRRQELIKKDPIHTTYLKTYIQQIFFSCVEANHGMEQFKINYQIDDILDIFS